MLVFFSGFGGSDRSFLAGYLHGRRVENFLFGLISEYLSGMGRRGFLSESTVQTPNSVSFLALTGFQGENSTSFVQPIICVAKRTAEDLSEFSPLKQYSQNNISPVSEFTTP